MSPTAPQQQRPRTAQGSFKLKDSVYVLEDPTVPGLYIALLGDQPRLKPLRLSTMAPAAQAGRAALCTEASQRIQGLPHELVRIDS